MGGINGLFGLIGENIGLILFVFCSISIQPAKGWYGQTDATRNTIVFFYATFVGMAEIMHCAFGFMYPVCPGSASLGKMERRQSTSWVDQSGSKSRPNAMDKKAATNA